MNKSDFLINNPDYLFSKKEFDKLRDIFIKNEHLIKWTSIPLIMGSLSFYSYFIQGIFDYSDTEEQMFISDSLLGEILTNYDDSLFNLFNYESRFFKLEIEKNKLFLRIKEKELQSFLKRLPKLIALQKLN